VIAQANMLAQAS